MPYIVVVTEDAANDIFRNAGWWATHRSVEQAGRWYDGIRDVIERLVDRPEQWPLARENAAFPFELRERHFGLGSHPNYRILYTIRDNRVTVLAVRNAAQDELTTGDVAPLE